MTLLTPASRRPQLPESFIPPLESGDRLTRPEFERRYAAMPENVRAELIEGVVIMASPVRHTMHGEPLADLLSWSTNYRASTPGVRGGTDSTVRLDLDNEPQPDAYLLIDPGRGGMARIDDDGYINGALEFVAEVAASTVSQDLGPKLNAYRRNGVSEYLVWRVQDGEIDWFILREGRFDRLLPDADGITRSVVFPGLWLDIAALLASDLLRVHAVLREGLADPAHAAFVADLAATQTSRCRKARSSGISVAQTAAVITGLANQCQCAENQGMADFTPTQGRYLAFIHAYIARHGYPPAESDIAAAMCVSPPSVNQMVKMLEKKGLILRHPGRPRSLQLLVPEDEIPSWNQRTPAKSPERLNQTDEAHFLDSSGTSGQSLRRIGFPVGRAYQRGVRQQGGQSHNRNPRRSDARTTARSNLRGIRSV